MKRLIAFLGLAVLYLGLTAQVLIPPVVINPGKAATASATASPAFIVGQKFVAAGNNPTVTVPTGGATPAIAGDCAEIVFTTATGVAGLTQSNALSQGFDLMSSGTGAFTAGSLFWVYGRYITPQDITAGSFTLTGVVTNETVCMSIYRHVTCGTDGQSTQANGANGSNQPPSVTNTLAGDMNVSAFVTQASAAQAYTPPSGYTNDEFISGVSGVSFGCGIDHKLLGAAGATQPGVGTITNNTGWGASQNMLINLGGTQ